MNFYAFVLWSVLGGVTFMYQIPCVLKLVPLGVLRNISNIKHISVEECLYLLYDNRLIVLAEQLKESIYEL